MKQPENTEASTRASSRGPTGLVGDVLDHATGIIRGEFDLVRAELQENLNKAMRAIGLLVGALVIILVALNVLAAAATAALAETGMGAGWAALIVGGVLVIIGVVMALKGKNDLSATSLAPTRTTRSIKRDAEVVREAGNGR